jgi:RNA polymerase sigma factor (sigma-70 family)
MNDELRQPGTEGRLFKDWPGPSEGTGRLRPDEETLLFKQLHYCAHRLSELYQVASTGGPRGSIKQRYGHWVQRYHRIRTRLTESNLGLVYDMISRCRFGVLDRDEMTGDGMMALLRAVDTFDPWRGYRFSTYACNAIIRAFSRSSLQESRRRRRITGGFEEELDVSDAPATHHANQRALFAERLQEILRLDNAALSDVEKTVLARRFPLEEDRPRQTLTEIGAQMRVSKERVRQIQLSAIAKLRKALTEDGILQ